MKKYVILIILFFAITIIVFFGFSYLTEIKNFYNKVSVYLFFGSNSPKGELTKLLFSIVGALGVFFGIWTSYKRANALEKGLEHQNKQYNLSLKSQIDQRFKNAIEHLGDEKEPIILGGIVELHQVAKENKDEYSEVIFNILCSYIRAEANIFKKDVEEINFTIIQTIVDYLFKNSLYEQFSANLKNTNLTSINFENTNLNNANLTSCVLSSFKNVTINGTNLSNAKFSTLNFLTKIDFSKANLHNTKFENSIIQECTFNAENLLNTLFYKTYITNSIFIGNTLSGCYFINCYLLNNAYNLKDLIVTIFWGTVIQNADFSNFNLFGSNDFRLASFNNVNIENNIITGSKFNGCNEGKKWDKNILSDLNIKIGTTTNLNGLSIDKEIFSKNQIGDFIEKDAIEIKKEYQRILEEHQIMIRKIKKF